MLSVLLKISVRREPD